MLSYAIVVVLAGLSLGDAKWSYTEVATADGLPCLADCEAGKCIVDWEENSRTCISSGVKAQTFSTSQVYDKSTKHCLSNCGFFGYNYEWCYTSDEGNWDYCISSPGDWSVYNNKCAHPCTKGTLDYYWCYVKKGSWQFCAPPASTNEPNVDVRFADKENLGSQNV